MVIEKIIIFMWVYKNSCVLIKKKMQLTSFAYLHFIHYIGTALGPLHPGLHRNGA